ncbi:MULTISPECIES: IS3 family transposase [unclassified Microbacterium]|uniref:IS3 family transposase n=1 Tax=unclassified Microbacterium TaxID=2609290 RepID=UPI00034E67C7|nr:MULTISPECIES: IS3 family transposase [unclassified Microbacterium]EPD84108.1 hypothetical protein HMPREF1529_02148 [Microbacterium sp. oral taxon 186 str. F0373]
MIEHLVATGIDAALACRVLRVSRSGFYAWKSRLPSERARVDEELTVTIIRIHRESRTSYGARRVHAELRLGLQIRCGKKRVARLMRRAGIAGISHRRKRGKNRPLPAPHEDLVKRQFVADRPDKLWVTDITEHPTRTGKVYCAAVVDVFSRRVVGWAIADHIRAELVVDALDMARWRRKPEPGTVVHSDRGSQYTSWVFGHRLRQAGLLGSMGRVASSVDNGLMESFWSTMQRELFDQQAWQSRDELGQAIFEWIEAWYNPKRRHSGIGDVSPLEFENTHHAAIAA